MYSPTHFNETRIDVMHALLHDHPLGAVVLHGPDGLSADQIPFEIAPPCEGAPFGVLRGHVARANPLWRRDGAPTMVLFQGASAYVSPAWYEDKTVSGKVVPTYNYATVQAHGTLRAIEEPAWLLALLERLTARHEGARAAPWSVHDAPRDYIDKLLGAIVGIEIPVERMVGKWKISQNRSRRDQEQIAAGLDGQDATAGMAALIAAKLRE